MADATDICRSKFGSLPNQTASSGSLSHRTQGEAKPCLEPRAALADGCQVPQSISCNSCTFFPVKVKGCCKEYHFCIFFCIRLFWYLRYLFVSEWAISYHQLSISWFFHSFSPWSAARKAKAGGELLRQVLCGSKTSLLGLGKFHHDRNLSSRSLGIMASFWGIIPKNGLISG